MLARSDNKLSNKKLSLHPLCFISDWFGVFFFTNKCFITFFLMKAVSLMLLVIGDLYLDYVHPLNNKLGPQIIMFALSYCFI